MTGWARWKHWWLHPCQCCGTRGRMVDNWGNWTDAKGVVWRGKFGPGEHWFCGHCIYGPDCNFDCRIPSGLRYWWERVTRR